MHIFHKWSKWEPYTDKGIRIGGLFSPKGPIPYTERRQKRHCEKCGKEQDEPVMPS